MLWLMHCEGSTTWKCLWILSDRYGILQDLMFSQWNEMKIDLWLAGRVGTCEAHVWKVQIIHSKAYPHKQCSLFWAWHFMMLLRICHRTFVTSVIIPLHFIKTTQHPMKGQGHTINTDNCWLKHHIFYLFFVSGVDCDLLGLVGMRTIMQLSVMVSGGNRSQGLLVG